jgi:hypothetical protein
MQEGGDRGKAPNKTGTQTKRNARQKPDAFERRGIRSGAGRARKAGPKKVAARTKTRSGDK